MPVEKFAKWIQNISTWIEKEEIPYRRFAEENTLTFSMYGDSFVYLPWEEEVVMDVEINVDSKSKKTDFVRTPRTLWSKPIPRVFHPKDVIINSWERDVQSARRIALIFYRDVQEIDLLERQGYYDKAAADHLRKCLGQKKDDKKPASAYYREWEGKYYNPDALDKAKANNVGIASDAPSGLLQMAKCFVRTDMDGDGIPEEVVLEVEVETGYVAYARYSNLAHKMRPIVQYYFEKRAGSIYNVGVPELLANLQKILNQVMRDILDNNKVQNTKMFLARKGGPIEEGARVYPSRIFFVDNLETDFKPIDLGTGRPVTSVADLGQLEKWGQLIAGVSDFSLGMEKRSRTPVGTTMALLEEGNKRIDKIIGQMRDSERELWWQVLILYLQNGDPFKLAKVAAYEAGDEEKFPLVWAQVSPELLRQKLVLRPEISSNSLNQSSLQQRALTLYGQLDAYYQRMVQLAQGIGAAQADPAMRELFMLMAKAGQRLIARVLDSYDERNQEELNPDLTKILSEVSTVEVTTGGSQPSNQAGRSTPASAAQGMASGQNPTNQPTEAIGRPAAGLGRVPGPTS